MTEIALPGSTVAAADLSNVTLDNSPSLYATVQQVYNERAGLYGPQLFHGSSRAESPSLFLSGLPSEVQREYSCKTCAKFMVDASMLVFVKDDGTLVSAIWDHTRVPEFYRESVKKLEDAATSGFITQPFRPQDHDNYSKGGLLKEIFNGTFGAKEKGGYNHFNLQLPSDINASHPPVLAGRINLLKQNMHHLVLAQVRSTLALFESGRLLRAEAYKPWLKWLLETGEFTIANAKQPKLVNNYLNKRAATAPLGWVEWRGSLLGALMEDLQSAADQETRLSGVIDRFNERADPENYMRAKAAATEGNIRAAAKKIAELGLEPAMHRRWAEFSEVVRFAKWYEPEKATAAAPVEVKPGLFDHLLPKKGADLPKTLDLKIPETVIPLFKFMRDVLPLAEHIEVQLPYAMRMGGFATALNPDAPPLMKWDHPERRNPFSPFVLIQPQSPEMIGLKANQWVNVRGVFGLPVNFFKPEAAAKENNLQLAIEGAVNFKLDTCALFKETLRSEMHEFGPTIEAFSVTTPLGEVAEENKMVVTPIMNQHRLRVTAAGVTTTYVIDGLEM